MVGYDDCLGLLQHPAGLVLGNRPIGRNRSCLEVSSICKTGDQCSVLLYEPSIKWLSRCSYKRFPNHCITNILDNSHYSQNIDPINNHLQPQQSYEIQVPIGHSYRLFWGVTEIVFKFLALKK